MRLALICCLLSGCAGLSWEEDSEFLIAQGLMTYDLMCQTTQIEDHPDLHESNPLLSSNPGAGEVTAYWLTSLAFRTAAYKWVKGKDEGLSGMLARGLIAHDAYFIQRNHQNGIRGCL